jgi:hypothetical protein
MENGTNIPESPQPAVYKGDERYEAPPPRRRRDLPYKTPFLAGFLSGIIPGLGHIYAGFFREGLMIPAVLAVLIVTISTEIEGLLPVAIVGLVFTYFFGIIDAVRRTQAYNLALDNDGKAPEIQGIEFLGSRGSRVGGIVLIVLGGIIFLNLQFDFSLAWLEDWWPLGMIALGVWLVMKSNTERKAAEQRTGGDDRPGSGAGGL